MLGDSALFSSASRHLSLAIVLGNSLEGFGIGALERKLGRAKGEPGQGISLDLQSAPCKQT